MIPVNTPVLGSLEKELLNECIESGWISSEGPFVKQFEEEFSNYIGRDYGIAVSSGSAALDIAVKAIGIENGDEVIISTFNIISPAFSIVKQGGIPVLVDCDPLTWNMDCSLIEEKISSKTKAILVAHIYGLPVDMNPILDLAKKYNLLIIEDAAEMHGQTYNGQKCGSFGDISMFSFYPNKHITTGEGGMVLTDNKTLAEKCSKYRNLSFEPHGRRFVHEDFGWNYRMTNMQAALGLGQLSRIDQIIIRKREIGSLYNTFLSELEGFKKPITSTPYADNIYWVYGLVADDSNKMDRAIKKLAQNKIGTRPFFWCMHEQPVFNKNDFFIGERYPKAERVARNGFYIPSGLGLSNPDIEMVSDILLHVD